MIILYDEENIS